MGKFYFAFAWDIIVNLHVCICFWSDPGVNLLVPIIYRFTLLDANDPLGLMRR